MMVAKIDKRGIPQLLSIVEAASSRLQGRVGTHVIVQISARMALPLYLAELENSS